MNLKREIIALAVRYLSENTNIVRQPNGWDEVLAVFTTGKTFDQRVADNVLMTSEALVDAVKKADTARKFKKIIKHV